MSAYLMVTSIKTGVSYKITELKEYNIDQSVEIPADGIQFIIGNTNYALSNAISAGDKIKFYVDNKLVVEGYIDDLEAEYTLNSNDARLIGRDKIAILLDNDAQPKTYNNIGLNDYLGKVLPKYGIKYSSKSNAKFKKIVVSPGENEYSIIEQHAKEKHLIPIYDVDDIFKLTNIISSTTPSYIFSNDNINNAIRIIDCNVKVSNDIRNEVIVYGGNFEKNKNIKGSYKDSSLKTKKVRIINDSNIETSAAAKNKAKEEFYNLNKNAFSITIQTNTKMPIYINRCARVVIKKMGLDALLYVDRVNYIKNAQLGSITNITLKLMPGIRVKFKNNDIPLLPKL